MVRHPRPGYNEGSIGACPNPSWYHESDITGSPGHPDLTTPLRECRVWIGRQLGRSHLPTPCDLGIQVQIEANFSQDQLGLREALFRTPQERKRYLPTRSCTKVLYQEFRLGGNNEYGLDTAHLLKKYQEGSQGPNQRSQVCQD
ncbi:hypothetical protein LXG23DRAFT_38023 [Yarrowia lipolytica]|nr:hypothetical protein BKA91DRAFT_129834 [Yarrowia lipolytica]KAE8172909.1 hypothetical protein BKA90DRAFT_128281 [Yarrowia lipolytica]KAJ8051963.1 hypothetical protein LXG23DRAFT_38023 [Yarrowia lipolytica]RMJ00672.1 hypothetical protein BD777DRAFT_132559 [Yarrowia lipolytica]